MPRYFFDIRDHTLVYDYEGVDFSSPSEAARYAKKVLREIAADDVATDSEHQALTVLVRDEEGHPIYSAALSYVGNWLTREAPQSSGSMWSGHLGWHLKI